MLSFVSVLLLSVTFTRAFFQENTMTMFGFCLVSNTMLAVYLFAFFRMLKLKSLIQTPTAEAFTLNPISRAEALSWWLTSESYSLISAWSRAPLTIKKSELIFGMDAKTTVMIFFRRSKNNFIQLKNKPIFYDQLEIRKYRLSKRQVEWLGLVGQYSGNL